MCAEMCFSKQCHQTEKEYMRKVLDYKNIMAHITYYYISSAMCGIITEPARKKYFHNSATWFAIVKKISFGFPSFYFLCTYFLSSLSLFLLFQLLSTNQIKHTTQFIMSWQILNDTLQLLIVYFNNVNYCSREDSSLQPHAYPIVHR